MRVREVTVGAARTFNHPSGLYGSLRVEAKITGVPGEGEDWEEATRVLQAKAEGLVEDQQREVLRVISAHLALQPRGPDPRLNTDFDVSPGR